MTENLEHFSWFANLIADLLSEEAEESIEKKANIVYQALLHYENNLDEDQRKELFFYMLGTLTRSEK